MLWYKPVNRAWRSKLLEQAKISKQFKQQKWRVPCPRPPALSRGKSGNLKVFFVFDWSSSVFLKSPNSSTLPTHRKSPIHLWWNEPLRNQSQYSCNAFSIYTELVFEEVCFPPSSPPSLKKKKRLLPPKQNETNHNKQNPRTGSCILNYILVLWALVCIFFFHWSGLSSWGKYIVSKI